MKCKRRSYHMPLYFKSTLERAKRRSRQRVHQRYRAGGHVNLMFRTYPARNNLSLIAWCKWGENSHD